MTNKNKDKAMCLDTRQTRIHEQKQNRHGCQGRTLTILGNEYDQTYIVKWNLGRGRQKILTSRT